MQRPKVEAPITLVCSLIFVVIFGLEVSGQQPVNGNCVDAESLNIVEPGQFFFDFTTVGTNSDSVFVEPTTCGFEEVFNNIWYCYTAPITGTGTVSTCQLTDFETRIVVFEGCDCPPGQTNVSGCQDQCPEIASSVSFPTIEGTQYLICIGAADPGVSGQGSFSVSNVANCDPLLVDFLASPSSGIAPVEVQLENLVVGTGPFNFTWDFGDGNFSDLPNPTHVYQNPGAYQITLVATDACNVSDKFTQEISVECGALTAAFSTNQNSSTAPFECAFFNDSTGSGQLTSEWNFGDGESSNEQNPVHFYSSPGDYEVTLTVTDPCSETSTSTQTIAVDPVSSGDCNAPIDFICHYGSETTIYWTNESNYNSINVYRDEILIDVLPGDSSSYSDSSGSSDLHSYELEVECQQQIVTVETCQTYEDGAKCDCKDESQAIPEGGGSCCPVDGHDSYGDPVYLFSGEFHESVTDMRIPGRGIDFVWARKYRSQLSVNSLQGNGWDSSYNIKLTRSGLPNVAGGPELFIRGDCNNDASNDISDPIYLLSFLFGGGNPASCEDACDGNDDGSLDISDAVSFLGSLFGFPSTPLPPPNSCGQDPTADSLLCLPTSCSPSTNSNFDLILTDGNSRRDLYKNVGNSWVRDEFLRVITENLDLTYTLTFPTTGVWNFHQFDGTPKEGKLHSIIDRNGNTLSFDYDSAGRLIKVRDTLDTPTNNREITIAYNGDGFIESVTDFAGRQVKYEYYQNGDSGGSFGDLKSVTKPAVTGTSNGNNFPLGKTTTYTYSTGFTNEQLNHNLLTITDGKGQTYLTNIYNSTQNSGDPDFDRIQRQIWGNPGDIIDYVYARVIPSSNNNFSVRRTYVNDRVGNVKEFLYDKANRNVIFREYTGRANPDLPTNLDINQNPPLNPLRPTDPSFFETRWQYNKDGLATQQILPNGNITELIYDQTNPGRRSQGNLIEQRLLPGPLSGDQAQIVVTFQYDDAFAGCCGTNFVTSTTDARGNITSHNYDSNGNRTHTQHPIASIVEDFEYNQFGQLTAHILPDNGNGHRRRDEFTFYSIGSQLGYQKDEIIDATGLALTSTSEYDLVGNVIRRIDPRGHDTLFEVNQLNQVVRETSREVIDGNGIRYQRDFFYDANNNVVRVDTQNIDDQGVEQANSHFTTITEYEILNRTIRVCEEVGDYSGPIPGMPGLPTCSGLPADDFVTTEYEYDRNRNQTKIRYGEATNGNQITNTLSMKYDERDLIFHEIRAEGDPDQSTSQYDYDRNGNLERELQGLEGVVRITQHSYDGYNRRISTTDPMGNLREFHYDPNGNLGGELDPINSPGIFQPFAVRINGELNDIGGSGANLRLSQNMHFYDPMNRLVREEIEFFEIATQNPIMGGQQLGKVITETHYSDNSQIIKIINDNLNATMATYDSVNRKKTVSDALGNTVTYQYDENSNITSVLEIEKSDLGNADQSFTTTSSFDNLDRLITITDNIGNTHQNRYDSLDNITETTDSMNHQTRMAYDGWNRLIKTVTDMNNDGANIDAVPGDGGPDIVTTQSWDDSSRLVGQTDDNGNVKVSIYDPLDRIKSEQFADQTVRTAVYDVHDNRIGRIDANGNGITSSYDLLNRVTGNLISPGAGISAETTFEIYKYDGLSRLVHAEDNDSLVTRDLDSLSRIIRETQNGQTTICIYDGVGNQTQCSYPGGRTISFTFDALERMKTAADFNGLVASYDYIGSARIERREYGNGTRTDYRYDGITGIPNAADDFGVMQVIQTTHTKISDGTVIDDRSYSWDRMSNKTSRTDLRFGSAQIRHDYNFDSTYRLTDTTVTNSGGIVVRDTDYDLDGVGNRTQSVGGPNPGSYTMNAATPEPADMQVNQYTTTPFDSREYDPNGNLTDRIGISSILYNYRNQMVEYSLTGGERHTYSYDALGRRITKVMDADGTGSGPTATRYFYHNWQVIEEQDNAGNTQASYVYGLFIDEVLNMQRGGTDYFYHTDDIYNVMAVTDANGNIAERYEYDDYGEPIDPITLASTPGNPSAIDNPYFFNGRRYDAESGWYFYRTRYLDPISGRFTTRDVIGMWGDLLNLGNGYTYVANNPFTIIDPLGLGIWDWIQGGLDVVGLVPVVGEAADLVNAGISTARGNYDEAALSLAAMCPIGGQAATGAKAALKAKKAKAAADAAAAAKKKKKKKKKNKGKYGDCSDKVGQAMQAAVNRACKTGKSKCTPEQCCDTLKANLAKQLACLNARNAIMNKCFKGGDKGHKQAAANVQKGIDKCKKLIAEKCSG